MKNKYQRYFVCVLSILCASMFVSCSQTTKDETVEITLMHGWGGTQKAHGIMQSIYEEFAKENPDIKLVTLPSPDSTVVVEKANDMLAVNKMPDIVSTNGLSTFVRNAVAKEKALDLMPYIDKDEEFKNSIHSSILNNWTTKDRKIYTLPDALEVMGFWYNKQIFKEAGITEDGSSNSSVKLPSNWEEFMETCEKIRLWSEQEEKDVAPFSLEKVQVVENLLLARLMGNSKGRMEVYSDRPYNFNNPQFRDTLEQITNLYEYSNNVEGIDNARQRFLDGYSAMYFNGVWESEVFQRNDLKYDIGYANYPTDTGNSLSYISASSGYVICNNKNPKKVEACIRFLKYMLSEEVQTRIALETGQAPSNPKVNIDTIKAGYPVLGTALEQAHSADIQIRTISSVWSGKVIDKLYQEIPYITDEETNKDILIEKLNLIGAK